jgi:hypothetical protein
MAVQLVSDLGLHLNLEFDRDQSVEDDKITSLRKNLFWAVQSSDTYDEYLTSTHVPVNLHKSPVILSCSQK